MKKLDLGQTVNTIANVGVIAGIVFLAFELRQNTIAVRSEASQGIQDQWISTNEALLDEAMLGVWRKGMLSYPELESIERGQFVVYWTNAMYAYENAYYQVRDGVYDAERTQGAWLLLRSHFEAPGLRRLWEVQGREIVSPEFRDFIESDVMQRRDVLQVWTNQ